MMSVPPVLIVWKPVVGALETMQSGIRLLPVHDACVVKYVTSRAVSMTMQKM